MQKYRYLAIGIFFCTTVGASADEICPRTFREIKLATAVDSASTHANWIANKTTRVAQTLAQLRARPGSAQVGAFGPDSVFWQISRERLQVFAAPRMFVMEMAHPDIAKAVSQSGGFYNNGVGRIQNTIAFLNQLIFGNLDQVEKFANAMLRIHAQALEHVPLSPEKKDELFLWVHATYVESTLRVFQKMFGKLSPDMLNRYYQDTKLFAELLGIPPQIVPKTYDDFTQYFAKTEATLQMSPEGLRLLTHLLTDPKLMQNVIGASLPEPILRHVHGYSLSVSLSELPENIRRDLPVTIQPKSHSFDTRTMGLVIQTVPDRFRFYSSYQRAMNRIEGSPNPIAKADDPGGSKCPFAALWKKTNSH